MQELTTFLGNHLGLSSAAGIVLLLLIIVEILRVKKRAFNISNLQATQLINRENAVIIDIRSPEAYRNGHIIDAQSLSAQEILTNPKKIEKFKKRPLILVGQTSQDAQKVTAFLIKRGYNAFSLTGGMGSWLDAQLPIVKK